MDELLLRFDSMHSVRKLGEGTFGEAFGTTNGVVFKVLPLEGDRLVNGEVQKTAGEILAEAAITLALSRLRQAGRWRFECFGDVFVSVRVGLSGPTVMAWSMRQREP